jgi:hypothetical protein
MHREGPRGWSVGGYGFFNSRRVQFATMAARDWVPGVREYVKVGSLTVIRFR